MLVVLGNGVFGQGIEFMDNEPWSKVLQRAKEQNRLIFMDCYTVWCGPCKGLAQDVFPQKQVGDFFNAHFVNVKYDMEKGEGPELAKKLVLPSPYRDHTRKCRHPRKSTDFLPSLSARPP